MSYDDGNDQGFPPWITALLAIRQGGGESTIRENEQISIRTRAGMQLAHAGVVMLAVCWFVVGYWLLTIFVQRLIPGTAVSGLSWLFVIVVGGIIAVVARVIHMIEDPALQARVFLGAILGAVCLVLVFMNQFSRQGLGFEDAVICSLGIGSMVGAGFLFYNQARSLTEPYWRESPFERQMYKLLSSMMEQQVPGANVTVEMRQMPGNVVVRDTNKRASRLLPLDVQEEVNTLAGEGIEDIHVLTIDPEQGNLVWFMSYAIRQRSLSVETLTIKPAPRLPHDEPNRRGEPKEKRLRKRMITVLIERGVRQGWFVAPSPGRAAEWNRRPGESLGEAKTRIWTEVEMLWKTTMGNIPMPLWTNTEYQTHVVEAKAA